MITSPDIYDYYDVQKLGNRLTRTQCCQKYKLYEKSLFRIKFPTKKSLGTHVYLPPPTQGGARGLKRLACLKYYNVWKCENRLTLELNAAENTDYMKKISSKSCLELNSPS